MAQIKREIAVICEINDLLNGSFVKAEGLIASYVVSPIGRISRANIIGVIISQAEEGFLLDDGSSQILLRSFDEKNLNNVSIGDLVMVIGRPRSYNDKIYLMVEIVKKNEANWAALRKAELSLLQRNNTIKEKKVVMTQTTQPVNYFQKIFEFIKDLDTGSGASIDEVLKRSAIPDGEKIIEKLIEEGEIFEIKQGMVKVLD